MAGSTHITSELAKRVGIEIGVDWESASFPIEELQTGMAVELDRLHRDSSSNATNDDLALAGRRALAHLEDSPDYYTQLALMEADARSRWVAEGGQLPVDGES